MRGSILFIFILMFLTACSTQSTPTATTVPTEPPTIETPSTIFVVDGFSLNLQEITSLNANQLSVLRSLELPEYMRGQVSQCNPTFSPDGKLVAAACGVNAISVWVVSNGDLFHTLDTGKKQIVTCTFSPDGPILACGGFDGKVTFWNAVTGTLQKEIAVIDSPVWDIAFSPDGLTLATCGIDDGVRLWNTESGAQLWESDATSKCLSLAFDPDGSVIAFGGLDGTVGVLAAADGKSIGTLAELGEPVGDITFDHHGTRLAAACDDDMVYLWTTGDATVIEDYVLETDLRGHEGYVNGIAFSSDDSLLISNSHDKSSMLWDLVNMNTRGSLVEHTSVILRGAFNPQGTLYATISWDGTLKLFGVEE